MVYRKALPPVSGWRPFQVHCGNDGVARSAGELGGQIFQPASAAFRQHQHRSVQLVADSPHQFQTSGEFEHPPAESHALHSAPDHRLQACLILDFGAGRSPPGMDRCKPPRSPR